MEQIVTDSYGELVRLPGMKHYNFTDGALTSKSSLRSEDYLGSVNGKDGLDAINAYLLKFLHQPKLDNNLI
jgi:hypothetical protein